MTLDPGAGVRTEDMKECRRRRQTNTRSNNKEEEAAQLPRATRVWTRGPERQSEKIIFVDIDIVLAFNCGSDIHH